MGSRSIAIMVVSLIATAGCKDIDGGGSEEVSMLPPVPSQVQKPKYQAKVPVAVTTPDEVHTRQLGTLSFRDGAPSAETVQKVYDNLDFYRGVETFLAGCPAASMHGYLQGMKEAGMDTFSLGLYQDMLDARSLWLTPNTTTLYGIAEINVKDGPTVLEVPSGVLGPVMDAYFRFVADVGFTGHRGMAACVAWGQRASSSLAAPPHPAETTPR